MLEIDQALMRNAVAAVRMKMPSCDWDTYGAAIAEGRQKSQAQLRKPDAELDRTMGRTDAFVRTGLMPVPLSLDAAAVTMIRAYFDQLPAFEGYEYSGVGAPQALSVLRETSRFAAYSTEQVLKAPQLFDVFNHPAIVDFVEAFMGCVPTLYSVNAWWSFPADAPTGLSMEHFHRDTDDWRFCTLFLYLTDVGMDGGPHQFVPRSHTLRGMEELLAEARARGRDADGFDARDSFVNFNGDAFSRRCDALFADNIASVCGPAGSMFLANTVGLHRGLVPARTARMIVWARYGLGPNTNSKEQLRSRVNRHEIPSAIANTVRNRYINRLMAQF